MHIFDRIRLQDIDRRDWQLWALAITMILILAVGIALLIYSSHFTQTFTFSGIAVERIFFAFCTLSVLFVGYLIERQRLIRRLRKELAEERKRNIQLRGQASFGLLQVLPGPEKFRDRLALELERAVSSRQPLSLLTVRLEASPALTHDPDIPLAFGDAVKAMMSKIRGEDSIYKSGHGVYEIILPGAPAAESRRVSARIGEGLSEAAGVSKRFSFDIQMTNYPAQTEIPRQIEDLAHTFAGTSAR